MTSKHARNEPEAVDRRTDGQIDLSADKRIDQVLAGLRAAEPDDGLERRLLAAVRQRGVESTAPRWRGFGRLRVPRWAWAVPATALVLSGFVWVQHGRHLGEHTAAPNPLPVRAFVAATTEATRTPKVGETTLPDPEVGSSERLRRVQSASPRRVVAYRTTVALANHPAPEAPLTEEERMLLRIANHSQPDDLAVLNPDARDAQAKADRAEFRKFFGPPPTGDRE